MNTRLCVENLSARTTESELSRLFSTYGNVAGVNIVIDRTSQKPRSLGFVTMVTPEAADAAIRSLNGKVIGAETLVVSEALPRAAAKKPSAERNPRRTLSSLY